MQNTKINKSPKNDEKLIRFFFIQSFIIMCILILKSLLDNKNQIKKIGFKNLIHTNWIAREVDITQKKPKKMVSYIKKIVFNMV